MGHPGHNRSWLVNSHMNGVAREKPLEPKVQIEQLLYYREQLNDEITEVNRQLQELSRTHLGAGSLG